MKLTESCPSCLRELIKITSFAEVDLNDGRKPMKGIKIPLECMVEFTVSDKNIYNIVCAKGHESIYIHPDQKFELLFQSGLQSYFDGYYRESVGSLAASLERFYEFAIKVICISCGINKEEFAKSWNIISKQSERQLGCFLFLYLLAFKKTAPTINNTRVNFRNSVIHNGSFPKKEDVFTYANEVLVIIYSVLKDLKDKFDDNLFFIYYEELKKSVQDYKDVHNASYLTASSRSFVKTILENKPDWTVEAMIDDIDSDRYSMNPQIYGLDHKPIGKKTITEVTVFTGDLGE